MNIYHIPIEKQHKISKQSWMLDRMNQTINVGIYVYLMPFNAISIIRIMRNRQIPANWVDSLVLSLFRTDCSRILVDFAVLLRIVLSTTFFFLWSNSHLIVLNGWVKAKRLNICTTRNSLQIYNLWKLCEKKSTLFDAMTYELVMDTKLRRGNNTIC